MASAAPTWWRVGARTNRERYVTIVITMLTGLYCVYKLGHIPAQTGRILDSIACVLLAGAAWVAVGEALVSGGLWTAFATTTGFLGAVLAAGNFLSLVILMGVGAGPFSLDSLAHCASVAPFPPSPWGQSIFFPTVGTTLMTLWFLSIDVAKRPMRGTARLCVGVLAVSQAVRFADSFLRKRDFPLLCFSGQVLITRDAWARTCSVQTVLLLGRAAYFLFRDPGDAYCLFLLQPRSLARYSREWSAERASRQGQRRRWALVLVLGYMAVFCVVVALYRESLYVPASAATLGLTLIATGLLLWLVDRSRVLHLRPFKDPDLIIVLVCGCSIPIMDWLGHRARPELGITFMLLTTVASFLDFLRPSPPRYLRVLALQFVILFALFGVYLSIFVHHSQTALIRGTEKLHLGHSFSLESLAIDAYSSVFTRALRASINAIRDREARYALFSSDRKLREVVQIERDRISTVSTMGLSLVERHSSEQSLRVSLIQEVVGDPP